MKQKQRYFYVNLVKKIKINNFEVCVLKTFLVRNIARK